MEDIYIKIKYRIKPDEFCEIATNAKRERVRELILLFLSTQAGKGGDSSQADERDVYTIQLRLNLVRDRFRTGDNTGNLCLRDGILLRVASLLQDMYSNAPNAKDKLDFVDRIT